MREVLRIGSLSDATQEQCRKGCHRQLNRMDKMESWGAAENTSQDYWMHLRDHGLSRSNSGNA